jgi:hypothetical protein
LSPAPPVVVRLALVPAPGWAVLVILVHGLAVLAALAFLPAAAAALVVAGLVLSGWLGTSAALLRGPRALREVHLRLDGSAAYRDGTGAWREAPVTAAATLGHRMAAFGLGNGRARRGIVLVPGAVDADAFRRARVWARWRVPAD